MHKANSIVAKGKTETGHPRALRVDDDGRLMISATGAATAVGEVIRGNWGGGTPTATPLGTAALAYDLDEPKNLWYWNGTDWV